MGALLALVVLIAWRAVASGSGSLYYIAAFFAIATQAVWSAVHLTLERLGTAVAVYVAFGLVSLGVPVVARRMSRPLQPAWGGGVVLLLGLSLLFFLSLGSVAPAALWALALLLAITNAALFIESAAGRLPIVSQVGSVLSWLLMMTWWSQAAGSVGVLPSLMVVVGLTLVTLAGHAWSVRHVDGDGDGAGATAQAPFARGLYLGLIGHLFLLLLATDRTWSLPPWPVFAALAAMTLATSAAALWSRVATMHTAGTIAAAAVVTAWSAGAGSPEWGLTAVLAAAAVSGYALLWQPLANRFRASRQVAWAAAAALFIGELSLIGAVDGGALPAFPVLLLAHVVNLCVLLTLITFHRWPFRGGRRRRARVAGGAPVADQDRPGGHVAEAADVVGRTLRSVCRVSVRRRPPRARQPRSVSRGGAGERHGVLRRARGVRRGRARLDDRRHPGDRGRSARAHAALAAEPRVVGSARSGTSRSRGWRRARVCHRRDSAPAEAAVDHDRLGARGRGAGVGLHAHSPSRALLLGRRAPRRGVRPAGAQP